MMSKKVEVNGLNEEPIYSYLKRACPTTQSDFSDREKLFYDKLHERDVRWNFEKFLIHPTTGQPTKRYHAGREPRFLAQDIMDIAMNRTTIGTSTTTTPSTLNSINN